MTTITNPIATLTAPQLHRPRALAGGRRLASHQALLNVAKIVVSVSAIIASAQVVLSAGMATDEYRLADLVQQRTDLNVSRQIMQGMVEKESSLQSLNAKARALGMVANTTPAFIRLSDEKVLGVPTPASK